MFANPILTESAGVNRHLFFSTFNYEWDRLRHPFLHESWINRVSNKTLERGILALSTYLGHVSMASTYWYLEATPVLLREIARAAENTHVGRILR